jgi:uncharacterized protein YutE (UPF0331/DUF86 family)
MVGGWENGEQMQIDRIKRYREKLDLILRRTEQINEWTANYDVKKFAMDEKTKLAVYKALQESIEASMDIVAMLCKDSKIIPNDDYTNIDQLQERGLIDTKLRDGLAEANGLRNRLVHRYNKIDDMIVFNSINKFSKLFKNFAKAVEQWLRENS